VPFREGVGFRQLCAFQVGSWWEAVMCPSCRGFEVVSYVPFS
jgi:hypothetical protein